VRPTATDWCRSTAASHLGRRLDRAGDHCLVRVPAGSFGKLNGTDPGTGDPRWIAVGAVAIGIVLAVLIQQ